MGRDPHPRVQKPELESVGKDPGGPGLGRRGRTQAGEEGLP